MTVAIEVNRRMLLQRALLLVGAASMPVGAEAFVATARAGPRLLDPAQFGLLTAMADTIIPKTDTPGAIEAGVPAKVDALLRSWASPARRKELANALTALEAAARRDAGKSFVALTPAERLQFLKPYDAAALKTVPRPAPPTPAVPLNGAATVVDPQQGKARQGAPQGASLLDAPPVADPGYAKLKELIITLYYYSEAALTHELPYVHSPGAWEPSVPVTAQTRPFGGAALM